MNLYFVLRYRPAVPQLTKEAVAPALLIGLLWTAFLFFFIPLAKGHANRQHQSN